MARQAVRKLCLIMRETIIKRFIMQIVTAVNKKADLKGGFFLLYQKKALLFRAGLSTFN